MTPDSIIVDGRSLDLRHATDAELDAAMVIRDQERARQRAVELDRSQRVLDQIDTEYLETVNRIEAEKERRRGGQDTP